MPGSSFFKAWGPIYWSSALYRWGMRLLRPAGRTDMLRRVAAEVEMMSVLDLCCGPGELAEWVPRERYRGLDRNPVFVKDLARKGVEVAQADIVEAQWPRADCVVMVDSLYHFAPAIEPMLEKMKSHARKKVIISESVENLSNSRFGWLAKTAVLGSRVEGKSHPHRFTEPQLRAVLEKNGFQRFYRSGVNLVAVREISS